MLSRDTTSFSINLREKEVEELLEILLSVESTSVHNIMYMLQDAILRIKDEGFTPVVILDIYGTDKK